VEAVQEDLFLLIRLAIAAALGGILGWEREKAARSAGLRTHMLVAMAGALITALSDLIIDDHGRASGNAFGYDPLRVLGAIVSGVSFLGAGAIFFSKDENKIQGLTTAASLLVTICIGVACGLERYALAVGTTVLQFAIVAVLRRFEPKPSA
jgi:putative Mg2+ transporter-C (MgtC) family protein